MTAAPAGDPGPASGREYLPTLTGLRFLAALVVILLHITITRSNPDGLIDPGAFVGRFTELGYLGVTFFFALSGFLLTWSAGTSSGSSWSLYRRRFARIYPLLFVTTILAGLAIRATGGTLTLANWILCLTLLQAWIPQSNVYFALNPVAWSLSCEAFFYLLTPVLLRWAMGRSLKTCIAAACLLAAAMLSVTAIVFAAAPDRDEDVWVSPWFSLGVFVAGMTLALAIKRGRCRWLSLRLATILLAVTAVILVSLSWPVVIARTAATLLILPALVTIVGAAAINDLHSGATWLNTRWMVRLGEWSFALYLIHKAIIKFLAQLFQGLPTPLVASVAVLVAIACSGAVYQFFEKPLEKFLRPPRRPRTAVDRTLES